MSGNPGAMSRGVSPVEYLLGEVGEDGLWDERQWQRLLRLLFHGFRIGVRNSSSSNSQLLLLLQDVPKRPEVHELKHDLDIPLLVVDSEELYQEGAGYAADFR